MVRSFADAGRAAAAVEDHGGIVLWSQGTTGAGITVALRSPGSAIDQVHGAHAVADDSYFRGTGTSMFAALTSGVLAQILQRNPALGSDQVKHRLVSTTGGANDAGAGEIDGHAAATSLSMRAAKLGLLPATGPGTLQGNRGSLEVEVITAVGSAALRGEWNAQSDPSQLPADNPLGLVPCVSVDLVLTGWDPLTWDLASFACEHWAGMSWKGMS